MSRKLQDKIVMLYRNLSEDSRKIMGLDQINHYVDSLEEIKDELRKRHEGHDWVNDLEEVSHVGKRFWSDSVSKKDVKERTDKVRVQLEKILLKLGLDRNEVLAPKKDGMPIVPSVVNVYQNQVQSQVTNVNIQISDLIGEMEQELIKRKPDKSKLKSKWEKVLTLSTTFAPVAHIVLKLIDNIR
jgi:hypothetical protein